MSITIGLQPPLNIQVSQSSATSCIESDSPMLSKPVTLVPSGAGAYNWYPQVSSFPSPSTITVRPVTSSCYTVIGTTSNCSGTAVACITVVPQFSIAVSPEVSSICEGESIGLSVSQVGPGAIGPESAFIYTWADTDTSLNAYNIKTVVASPSAGTGYTVVVRDADGCLCAPATVSVTVNVCTDISEEEGSRIAFFPNPFNDYLDISVGDAMVIEITNAFGEQVMTIEPCREKISRADTSLLLPGIYFVIITNRALQKSGVKVIKN